MRIIKTAAGKKVGAEKYDRWFSYSIILLPFLYQYKGIGNILSLGELLVGIITIIELLRDRFIFKNINLFLLAFYIVSLASTLFCTFFNYFEIVAALALIIRLLFFALVIIVARKHFNIDSVKEVYTALSFLFSLYLIIQYFFHMTTGGYLPITLNSGWQFPPEARPEKLAVYYRWFFRASSFFLEPGYFTLYVMPAVCMLVFKQRKTAFEFISLVTTIIAILFSTASAGLTSLLIIFAVYLFDSADRKSKYKFIIKIAIVFVAVFGIIIFFTKADAASLTLGRLKSGGSFSNRITRGLIAFSKLSWINKVVGVGLNNLEPYMLFYGLSTAYDEGNLNYTATFLQALNYSGIMGLCFLFAYICSLFSYTKKVLAKQSNREHEYSYNVLWSILFIIIFIMSFEAMMFSYRFAFYIIIYESLCRKFVEERNSGI